MGDYLTGEALRLHLIHCDGCPECAHVAPDGRPYGATWPDHPDARADRLARRYFGPDAQAFGPGEDYEGREARRSPEAAHDAGEQRRFDATGGLMMEGADQW